MGRLNPTSPLLKERKAASTVKKGNAAAGKKRRGSLRSDCLPPSSDDSKIVAEAEEVISKSKGPPAGQIEAIDRGTTTTTPDFGLSSELRSAAMEAGLDRDKIIAAMFLAQGASIVDAAAHAGVTPQTIRNWSNRDVIFVAFLNQLTIAAVSDIKATALREVYRQIKNSPDKALTTKDVFDWVKLAVSVDHAGGAERRAGQGSTTSAGSGVTALHQHLHVHGNANGVSGVHDNAALLNLGNLSRSLPGEKRRKLADLLRADDGNNEGDEGQGQG